MYKLLIIEDEDIIRHGLVKIIQKTGFNLMPIEEAANGVEALELIQIHQPDIVITDLKMPKMDGLEFLQRLRELQIKAPVIILSGYEEFNYAQKAIRYGVVEYLLKPVNKADLHKVLSLIIDRLNQEHLQESEICAEKNSLMNQVNELQRILFQDILEGNYLPDECAALIIKSGLDFGTGRFLVLDCTSFSKDPKQIQNFIDELTRRISSFTAILFIFDNQYDHKICVLKFTQPEQNIVEKIYETANQLITLCTGQIYLGISKVCEQPGCLNTCCRQARDALNQRIFHPGFQVFCYFTDRKSGNAKSFPTLYYESVSKLVCNGCSDKGTALLKATDDLFQQILSQDELSTGQLLDHLRNLFFYILKLESGDPANEIDEFDVQSILESSLGMDDLKNNVLQKLLLISGNMKRYSDVINNTIHYIIEFVEKNYPKDLCLNLVANSVSMNPNYFCSLFKNKMGISFTNYLQKIRIEKAKNFLLDPNFKVYDVSEKVGFHDEKYFYKVFKKLTGLTPNEFRNQSAFKSH